jgi:DNA-binding NarL/FixJ family response regulator
MLKARVLLADDNAAVANALAEVLEDECELVGIAHDGLALLKAAQKLRPDVIVADISMPLMSGLDVARQLQHSGATIKVILLTAHQEPQLAAGALQDGASGYVLKHCAGEELITALNEVIQGRTYVSPLIAKDITPLRRV